MKYHMGLFFNKKLPLLGIDISPTAIRLLELGKQRGGGYRIERYATASIPVGAVTQNHITDIQLVGQAIKRAWIQSGATGKHAAIAVSGSAVISKIIQMPKDLSEHELQSAIELEAGQHIPFPLEDVSIDFEVLGPNHEADKINVLLAASRTEPIDERVAALDVAGLQAQIVDIEGLAIERACHQLLPQATQQPVAVLHMDAYTTTLYVLQQGRLVDTHEQDFADHPLTNMIQQRSESVQPQEHLVEDSPRQILASYKQHMAQDAKRALQFYTSAHPGAELSALVLSGANFLLPGAMQAIREQITLPLIPFNLFRHIKTSDRVKPAHIQHHAPALLVAYGLALRGAA